MKKMKKILAMLLALTMVLGMGLTSMAADKVITVIGHKFAPRMMRSWGREGRGSRLDNLRHACYVYFHHPRRSAEFLKEIGAEKELIELVFHHHEPMVHGERIELTLLRQADEMH